METSEILRERAAQTTQLEGGKVPTEYAEEYALCAKDEWHWMINHVKVEDKARGLITSFQPWDHLWDILVLYRGSKRIIILKARQVGVSWFWAAIALHVVLFTPNTEVLMLSKTEDDAISLKAKSMFIYRHLPEWMKQPTGKDNDSVTTFPVMESMLKSFPATEGSGRGETASLVILDEWAYHPYAEKNMTAILPTVEHSKIVGISTANGRGGVGKYFYDTWKRAQKGRSKFKPIFFPYDVVPGRDEQFLTDIAMDMEVWKVPQEYPVDAEKAFIVSGTCMFDVNKLNDMPLMEQFSTIMGMCEIYKNPIKGRDYVAGIDTALGIAGGDFSVVQIVDVDTGEVVAKLRGRIPIEEFGGIAYQLLHAYGDPFTIIEMQFQGSLVVKSLKDLHYPIHKLFHRTKATVGWHTTETNRNNILAELESGIRTGQCTIYSDNTVEELLSFGYNEDKGKFEALSGHDDEVMSLALAWHAKCTFDTPMEDFTPIPYTDGEHSDYILATEINWAKKNPMEGLVKSVCPICDGSRIERMDDGDVLPCDGCEGLGSVLRRIHEEDKRPDPQSNDSFLALLTEGLERKGSNVGRGAVRV